MQLYQENQKKMSQGGQAGSTLKGAGSEETHFGTEGLEVCRRACGGHGYSSFSGIGPWYSDYLPTTT